MQASFCQQLRAMVLRNYLLKRRNSSELLSELCFPIVCVLLIVIVKYAVRPQPRPAATFPVKPLTHFSIDTSKPIFVATPLLLKNDVSSMMQKISRRLNSVSFKLFYSEKSAEKEYLERQDEVSAGIMFEKATDNTSAGGIRYIIRMPLNSTASNSKVFSEDDWSCVENDDSKCEANFYLHSGHALLQTIIDGVLIEKETKTVLPNFDVKVQMMDIQEHLPDVAMIIPFYFMFAYSFFISCLTVNIVAEREERAREGMFMMGLRNSVFWASWSVLYFVIIAAVTVAITLVATLAKLFENSNMFLLFIMLMLYGLSIVALAFFLTTFFNKAHTAGAVTSLPTIIIAVLYVATIHTPELVDKQAVHIKGFTEWSLPALWLVCLFPPLAFAFAVELAVFLDTERGGMDFNTIYETEFPLLAPLLMLIADIFLYILLAVYLDHVIPHDSGPRYGPGYFLRSSYWCPQALTGEEGEVREEKRISGPNMEPVSQEMRTRRAITINNVTKTYGQRKTDFRKLLECIFPFCRRLARDEEVTAVRKLSLELYEGQITALLGHNGAGKTSVINMLSGLTRPSSGSATIYGYDVFSEAGMANIRGMCGICLQRHSLYPELTAAEHLQIFAALKGIPHDQISLEISQVLKAVGLTSNANVPSSVLTGGQKRKLAVALAIIGDPKVLLLDEPTTGMDPFSRRYLWSLLKNYKEGRVILLSTHFMDEADILADRKAILGKGKLQCVGSSLYLKHRFGMGYHLNMVVGHNCQPRKVTDFLEEYVRGVVYPRIHGKELAYTIPLSELDNFVQLFKALEETDGDGVTKAESLGILNYSVSMPTLEEVFLKLGTVRYVCVEEDGGGEITCSPTSKKTRLSVSTAPESQPYGSSVDPRPAIKAQDKNNKMTEPERPAVNAQGKSHEMTEPKKPEVEVQNSPVEPEASLSPDMSRMEVFPHRPVPNLPSSGAEMNPTRRRFFALLKLRFLKLLYSRGTLMTLFTLPMGFVAGILLTPRATNYPMKLSADLYVRPVNSTSQRPLPAFLLYDLVRDSISRDFCKALSADYAVRWYTAANISRVTRHFVGVRILATDSATGMIKSYAILYDFVAVHSLPAAINAISTALLRQAGSSRDIVASSKPWPSVLTEGSDTGFAFGLMVGLAFTLMAPSLGIFVISDRTSRCRNQLRISGVSPYLYWASTCLFGILVCLFPTALCIVIAFAAGVVSLTTVGAVVALVLLFMTSSQAYLVVVLFCCLCFNKEDTAKAITTNILSMCGMASYMAVAMLESVSQEKQAASFHVAFVCINPMYTVFGGVHYIHKVYRTVSLQARYPLLVDYFTFDSKIPVCLIANVVDTVLGYALLVLIDKCTLVGSIQETVGLSKPKYVENRAADDNNSPDEDEDVAVERMKVETLARMGIDNSNTVAYVRQLRREFSSTSRRTGREAANTDKVAVKNLSFAVNKGEVLGLMGHNGSGKTTTVRMMTGEIRPTCGSVVIARSQIRSNIGGGLMDVGFCPQIDALWEPLDLTDHLMIYAAIKGVPQRDTHHIVNYFIESLKLQPYRDKPVRRLSYGTRRKLSYAIAMLGNPKVVLLDEPSTGMDPRSKRFFWDTISSSFEGSDRGAILTTHYMEEADALCSRVGILVNGQLECLGPTQRLKSRFGKGYVLDVKLSAAHHMSQDNLKEVMARLENYLVEHFPNSRCLEKYGECALYKIPSEYVVLSSAFEAMENARRLFEVEYSFSQATLEQVFMHFARHEEDRPDGANQRRLMECGQSGTRLSETWQLSK
ncbi:hypothetical protein BaRGS_00024836 [Batillaria attramentaria]|uniref:ABC transporter domain-containing protein n=1 Tax=Batillaria attramentaria TaxID=370345 RepID=A0ABD0KA50_9CAEN